MTRSSRLGGAALATATLATAMLALLIVIPAGARPKTAAAPATTTTVYDWGWENPLPQGLTLLGVSCPSASLCKAVGDSGTIMSWNGTSWSADSSGTTSTLQGVSCPTATLCKAVGWSGTIVSWNGTSWSADSSGTTSNLYGVSCPTATLCKAVGDFGTILSWNGTSWSADSSGTTSFPLRGVSCPTATLCKAVGDYTILSWNGTSWSADSFPGPSIFPIHGVSCPTATLCKAVGISGHILSWNGASWSEDSSGTFGLLRGVSCPTATLCKAVGDGGTIVSWNGASWSADSSGTTTNLLGVSCSTATLCKAVGWSGTILSWNGTSWSADSSGTASTLLTLYGVSCLTATHAGEPVTLCKAVGSSAILGMVAQTLTDVDAGFALDLFHTGCLDGLAITQTNSNHPNATAPQQTGKYWTITVSPVGCTSGYSAFLTLPTSFTPNSSSSVCRYTGTGTSWECAQNGFTASSVSRWGITQFSDWAASTSGPTAVKLSRLAARTRAGGVAVSWQTASEIELVGFNLYRQQRAKLVKLNRLLIPSVSGGTPHGHAYSFLDRSAPSGKRTLRYKLQAVTLDGTRSWIGSATVVR